MEDASVALLVIAILLFIVILGLGIFTYRIWRRRSSAEHRFVYESGPAVAVSISEEKSPEPTPVAANYAAAAANVDDDKDDRASAQAAVEPSWKVIYQDLQIAEKLGEGEMGTVFKARWNRGLDVVSKELNFKKSNKAAVMDEVQRLVAVRHPNLVLLVGVCSPSATKLCLISELMSFGNLYKVLHNRSIALSNAQKLSIITDVLRAMNYLHLSQPPVIHNNLNSTNVLISSDLVAKVGDYGLDNVRKLVINNAYAVPCFWKAPELLKPSDKPVDPVAVDLFSFAVIAWETITRKTPYYDYPDGNSAGFVTRIATGARPTFSPNFPETLKNILSACWSNNAQDRPRFGTVLSHVSAFANDPARAQERQGSWEPEEVAPAESKDSSASLAPHPWIINWSEVKVESMIGSGSFGQVFSGQFRGKKVAIKRLKGIKATSQKALANFERELSVMSLLRHPNVVLFMGACTSPDTSIVMEFCDKGNLFDVLHDSGTHIDFKRIIKILTEAADGMNYLHLFQPNGPIIHRDLKSPNILLDEHWNVKISDFGLTTFKADVTESDLQLGTPFWLAPECMETSQFTPASDVYSFGIVTWEMFTRLTPFPGLSPHQVPLAVVIDNKRPDIPPFVPPRFAALMRASWQKRPQDRPTFSQILQQLHQCKIEGLPRQELSLATAKLYQKRAHVFAFMSLDSVVVNKSWGTGEGKKGDWVVVGPGEDVYTCDANIFAKTYEPVPGHPNKFKKTGLILAKQMDCDFLLETMEGMEHGDAGDFVAQNPHDHEQWPIDKKTFLSTYELCPDQEAAAIQASRKPVPVSPVAADVPNVYDDEKKGD